MRWKRPLFLFHRWSGIVLCLFFALWFVSGLFMMYVEFPQLTRNERLAGAATLDFSRATLGPAAAVARLHTEDFVTAGTPSAIRPVQLDRLEARAVRLAMVAGRPAYIVYMQGGAQPRTVFADDGAVLHDVDDYMAREAVLRFARRSGLDVDPTRIEDRGTLLTDQWTVSSALNDHRPLRKYALNDVASTELYVSARTGEVVRDSHGTERWLNYFGAVTHWLYPTFVRKYPVLWEWLVDVLSTAGVLLGISGLWVGVLRWKRKRAPGKPAVPYRGLMRWHYFTGIVFGVFATTWVLSGLLSMNPLDLNPSRQPEASQQLVYTGKSFALADFALPADGFATQAVEAEPMHYLGQPFYRVTNRDGSTTLYPVMASATLPQVATMMSLAPALLPSARIEESRLLTEWDNYWYTRHPERGEKPLPVIRIRFDDADATWFHLDPGTGRILERSTRTNRLYRWLYNGLHSWDIRWLWERRPLWDIVVIAFSLGGALLSILGVVIGVRRLRYAQS